MKKLIVLCLLIGFAGNAAQACEFMFSVLGTKKDVYEVGDTLTIHVKYVLTHRVCKVVPKDTKFKFDGIQITSASEWKEVSTGTFARDVKAKVIDDKKDKITLSAIRTCDKEGGHGMFSLPKKP